MSVVTIYNAGNESHAQVAMDFRSLIGEAQVVGVVEVADRAAELNASGGNVVHTKGGDRGHIGALVAGDVTIVQVRYVRCTRRSVVGAWGAGPGTLAGKWLLVLLLRDATGFEFTVIVTHFVPSVTRPARTLRARIGRARRRKLYRKHVAVLVDTVNAIEGPVDVIADWNAEADFELLAPLVDDAGLTLSFAPSHGGPNKDKAAIDGHAHRDMTLESIVGLPGFSSDHRPVEAVLSNPAVDERVAAGRQLIARGIRVLRRTHRGDLAAMIDAIRAALDAGPAK